MATDAGEARFLALRIGPDGRALLELEGARTSNKPLRVDFAAPRFLHRLRSGGREALVRAVRGKRGRSDLHVVDMTAGLGVDSFVLAHRGARVAMIERSPLLAALLADGLERAQQHTTLRDASRRLTLTTGDSCTRVATLSAQLEDARFDCAYLDPMFPPSYAQNSALPKRAMQVLRALIGHEADEASSGAALFDAARTHARRVVVKRPRSAACIGGIEPSRSQVERSCRYDIYIA